MLRITKTFEDDEAITLRLDGKVINSTLPDLEKLCLYYRDRAKKTLLLDFSGVTFIDGGSLTKLAKMKDGRVKMVNGSLFVETLLSGLKD